MITTHAQTRMQQRSIAPIAVDLLIQYGSEMRHKGANVLYFDKAARRQLKLVFGGTRSMRMIEPLLNTYAVEDGSSVITAGHRTKRLKRDCSRQRG